MNTTQARDFYQNHFAQFEKAPPVEIEARKMTRMPEGWLCTFDWWQVVRFLPLTNEHSHIALELDGVFEDGTAFVLEAAVDLRMSLEQ